MECPCGCAITATAKSTILVFLKEYGGPLLKIISQVSVRDATQYFVLLYTSTPLHLFDSCTDYKFCTYLFWSPAFHGSSFSDVTICCFSFEFILNNLKVWTLGWTKQTLWRCRFGLWLIVTAFLTVFTHLHKPNCQSFNEGNHQQIKSTMKISISCSLVQNSFKKAAPHPTTTLTLLLSC